MCACVLSSGQKRQHTRNEDLATAQLIDDTKRNVSDAERNLSDTTKSFNKVVKSTQILCDKVVEIEEKQKQQLLQLDQQEVQIQFL